MGQNGSVSNNPLFNDWKQNSQEPNIFTNTKTHDQVQKFTVAIGPNDQFHYKRRMQEQHQFIVKVHYFQPTLNRSSSQQQQICAVYTDRLMPIKKNKWEPVITALRILKGFRRLSTTYGLMKVTEDMVKMNEKDQIKVWTNKNPALNQPNERAINQEQMLTDITRIIIRYDAQTSAHLIGCLTLNQAINNILVSMAESKTQANLSSRTLRPEQKSKKLYLKGELSAKNKSNQFRQTKETEDEFPKPLYSNQKRGDEKLAQNRSPSSKYLLNVHVPHSPKYLPLGSQTQKRTGLTYGYKNNISDVIQRNQMVNFSDKLINKQSNCIQFNSLYEDKKESQTNKKKYRGVQHKIPSHHHIGATSSILGYTSGSPKHEIKMKHPSPQYNSEIPLKKTGSGSEIHFYERKSDLHREYAHGRDEGRASDFTTLMQGNNKLKINSSEKFLDERGQKDGPFYYPKEESTKSGLAKQKISQNLRFDNQSRTKTQQFNTLHLSQDNSWNSYGSEPYHKKKAVLKSGIQNEEARKNYEAAFDKRKQGINNNIGYNKITGQNTLNTIDLVSSTKIQVVQDEKSQFQIQKQTPNNKLHKMKSFPNVSNGSSRKAQKNSQEKDNLDSNNNTNYEQKKVKKQEMSKKIRQQFSSILSPPSRAQTEGSNRLTKEKSAKDILIRQKIQKKKAIFAGLKDQMKVLMGD